MAAEQLRVRLRCVVEALGAADQVLGSGRIKCGGPSIDKDLERFRGCSQAIQSAFTSSTAASGGTAFLHCLRCITDYGFFVEILASKTALMQILYHNELAARSERAHTAMDRVSEFVKLVPVMEKEVRQHAPLRMDQLRSATASIDFNQLANQLEPLAFITRLEQQGRSLDAVTQFVKYQILACAVDYVKTATSTVSDWYMSECDLVFTENNTSGMVEDVVSGSAKMVRLRCDFVSRGWEDPYDKITPQEQFALAIGMWYGLRHENLRALVRANQFSLPDALVAVESCELGSLDVFLQQNTTNRQQRAIELLIQAAQGVCYLHSVDFVHGDLRCANIHITADQKAQVAGPTDYLTWFERRSGIQVPNKAANPDAVDATRWLAPECVAGQSGPTQESDVYAFGMTIYEAIAGAVPFAQYDDRAVQEKKPMLNPQPMLRGHDKLDGEIWGIIQDACHLNPAKRPTMQILLERLRGVGKGPAQPVPSAKATDPSPNIKPATAQTPPVAASPQRATAVVTPLPPQQQEPPQPQPASTQATNSAARASETKVSAMQAPQAAPLEDEIIVVNSSIPRWMKITVGASLVLVFIMIIVVATKKNSTIAVITTQPAPTAAPIPTPAPTPPPTTAPPTKPPSIVYTYASGFTTKPVTSITIASDSTIYVSDAYQVFRLTESNPYPAPFAGTTTLGYYDSSRTSAQFYTILGLAVDTNGNVLVADADNFLVRSVSASTGQVATFAGNSYYIYSYTGGPFTSGSARSVSMGKPYDVATDASNNVYVADFYGDYIRKVWAGSARVTQLGQDVKWPRALAVTPSGAVYVASRHGIIGVSSDGLTTWAVAGSVSTAGFETGTGENARFDTIRGLALSPSGDELYVADTNNHCIRKVHVNTFLVTTIAGECQSSGSTNGGAFEARFIRPMGIAVGANGVIYVVDGGNSVSRLRKITL